MYLALVYYPPIENKDFLEFRETYEPFHALLPPHVPFIFPLEESFGMEKLKEHILTILDGWNSFEMHFCKLKKTWDHWLFLGAKKGNKKAVRLHDELYSGELLPYLREDLPYTPHIGLGFFGTEAYDFQHPTAELTLDKKRYKQAKKEFKALNFELWCQIDKLTLVRVNEEFTVCEDLITFELK